jgi:phosphatidate cytidylyltransferase
VLLTRALVGILGVPLAILVVYTGGIPLLVSLIILSLLGLHEFYRMTRSYRPNLLAGYIGAAVILWGAYDTQMAGVLRGVIALFVLTFLLHAIRGLKPEMVGEMAVTFFGSCYVSVGFAFLMLLRSPDYGISLAIVVLLATWTSDTVAYAVGHFYGHHRITPVASPNKTLEGTAAGFIGTILVVLVAGKSLGWMEAWQSFVLGLTIALAAPVGDLFESYLKRASHVKDAGTIIPGHGGILDRFDSLLFAGVAAYYIVSFMIGSG